MLHERPGHFLTFQHTNSAFSSHSWEQYVPRAPLHLVINPVMHLHLGWDDPPPPMASLDLESEPVMLW